MTDWLQLSACPGTGRREGEKRGGDKTEHKGIGYKLQGGQVMQGDSLEMAAQPNPQPSTSADSDSKNNV